MSTPAFRKATREAVKLKIAVQGPSGSGKTLGALEIARGLGGKIALIDTENGSASLYADRLEFDVLDLEPPYTSARYLGALKMAVEAGYGVVIVDSLSHQWAGAGGILGRKEDADAKGGNSFQNWGKFSKEHGEFLAAVLALPIHLIATIRTKSDYVIEKDERGKSVPKKVGLAPVQREGVEYEFSVVFEMQMDHKAAVSKDRTGLFDGKFTDLTDGSAPQALTRWLASGAAPRPQTVEDIPVDSMPAGKFRGVPLEEVPYDELVAAEVWAQKPGRERYLSAFTAELSRRRDSKSVTGDDDNESLPF